MASGKKTQYSGDVSIPAIYTGQLGQWTVSQ